MPGVTLIVILLVPITFQVFYLSIMQKRRHDEVMESLRNLEKLVKKNL